MSNIIKTNLERFLCEKLIDEKFHKLSVSKDMILLHSEYTSIKGCKKKCKIDIGRNIISLHTEKVYLKKHQRINTKEDNTICVNGEQITLKSSQNRRLSRNSYGKNYINIYMWWINHLWFVSNQKWAIWELYKKS